jgi:hypothetical protein
MSLSRLLVFSVALAGICLLSGCGEETTPPEKLTKDIQAQNKPQDEMPEHLKGRGFSGARGPAKGGK